uniref:Alpha-amylase n=1 Tax=Phaffia rhodozyma TaxID=264483 RepID=A0A1C9UKZ9_PHARH|nr:alpha-amylase [Phaffia rhodozyma]
MPAASILLPALLSSLTLVPRLTNALSAAEWRDKSIYQVVTDRFSTGSLTTPCYTTDKAYCGGTWAGITARLDYIQGMGFDAVWISPITSNIGNTTEGQAYHGYWPMDFATLNSHFGTADDLKALSAALHTRGMYLMADVVVNHVATTQGSAAFVPTSDYGEFDTSADFHPFCWVADDKNQTQVEQCWLGTSTLALADIDTESTSIVAYMNTWIKTLVSDYSIDGLRIDTVKHIRKDFWPGFASSAGVFTMGEILDGSVAYNAPYQDVLDSVLNYPLYYQIMYAFQYVNANLGALVDVHNSLLSSMNDTTLLGTFVDNHDQPRLASLIKDTALLGNAYTYPFITDGVPIVYYGQEQGFSGGADPANREPMWTSSYATDGIGYALFKKLTAARKQAGNSSSTFYTNKATISYYDANEIVISKPPMLAILSNRGSSGSGSVTVPSNASLPEAAEVVDILTCTSWRTDKNGASVVSVSNGQPQVILPLANIGTLCPGGVTASTITAGSTDTTPANPSSSAAVASASASSSSTSSAATPSGSTASGSGAEKSIRLGGWSTVGLVGLIGLTTLL